MQSHGLEVIYIACNIVFCILLFWAQLFFIHEIVCLIRLVNWCIILNK